MREGRSIPKRCERLDASAMEAFDTLPGRLRVNSIGFSTSLGDESWSSIAPGIS